MPLTVLITGFGPFPGAPFNPTAALAQRLAARRRPAFADIKRVAHLFETSYAAVERELPVLLRRVRPDVVLLFGVATRTKYLRVEMRARNARSPLFPDLPTIDESGVPGFEDITFNGLVAPAGTPREILVRLNEEVAKIVRAPNLHKRFLERGVELKASASPEEFTALVKAEVERKGKLARDAGIKLE